MNRGSLLDSSASPQAPRSASMRPRFMNRGSDELHVLDVIRLERFNEAPIHESGK